MLKLLTIFLNQSFEWHTGKHSEKHGGQHHHGVMIFAVNQNNVALEGDYAVLYQLLLSLYLSSKTDKTFLQHLYPG